MIKIITDSASDIEPNEAKEMGITVIPMEIQFGEEQYLDGVTLTKKHFFEKLTTENVFPKTSQINPQRFEEVYDRLTQNGDSVIVITLSSKLSGTYNNAKLAAEKYNGKVCVIDSLSATAGERMLCQYALEQIKIGKNMQEICENLNIIKHNLQIFAILNTLTYLKKGGRISSFTAFAGEIISIRPIITIINGEVKIAGKAIGTKKAEAILTNKVKEYGINFDLPFSVIYSGANELHCNEYINNNINLWGLNGTSLQKHMIGSTIGAHIGPNAIGVAFFKKLNSEEIK